MTKKEVKVTVVSFEQFSDYEFNPPATFYIMDCLQNYHFVHTSDRKVAQDWVDETFGKGRYTVKASKIQKTKFKSESGTYSAVGVATRKGQKKYN
jgi:hypothetical protein